MPVALSMRQPFSESPETIVIRNVERPMRLKTRIAAVVAISLAGAVAANAGTYAGAFGGYAALDVTARTDSTPQDYDGDGGLLGVQAGHDWKTDGWVYGVAADLAYDFVHASIHLAGPVTFKTRQEWEGSLRARLGYEMSGFTPYVTGGVAFGQFETKYTQIALPFFVRDHDAWGWTLGAGAEVPVSEGLSFAIEYRYSDFGTNGDGFPATPDGPHEFTSDRVTAGLNWAL